jgi:hypothetical protein
MSGVGWILPQVIELEKDLAFLGYAEVRIMPMFV